MMETQGEQRETPALNDVVRQSADNMLKNLDVMEDRILCTLQRFREDLLRIKAST